jgi:tripartite-type tricarboxylate transporter receptor subunit TctC
MNYRSRILLTLWLPLALVVSSVSAQSAGYPTRPIQFVVPYAAGGGADVIARAVAKSLGDSLKQPVMVDNKPGGAGQVAAAYVARANPDGYTLLLNLDSIYSINPALKGKPAEDALAHLAPVANIVGAPVVIAVRTGGSENAQTLADLIALAQAKESTPELRIARHRNSASVDRRIAGKDRLDSVDSRPLQGDGQRNDRSDWGPGGRPFWHARHGYSDGAGRQSADSGGYVV